MRGQNKFPVFLRPIHFLFIFSFSEKKLRSKWYQDPSYAHFTIYYKNLQEEQVKVYFEREKLTVDVHFDDGKIARE